MADIVQARLDDLENLAMRFIQQSECMQELCNAIVMTKNNLEGEWIGRGANSFFQEMDQDVLPGVQRLVQALGEAGSQTNQICRILSQADEEAAAPFRVEGDSYASGGGGSDHATPPSMIDNNRTSTIDSLIDGLEDRFEDIFPNGLDNWNGIVYPEQSGFPQQGMWINGPTEVEHQLGYGSITDVINGWIADMGFGDTFGSNPWESFPFITDGNENGFFVPQDWLDGVIDPAEANNNDWGIPENWLDGVAEGVVSDGSGQEINSENSSDGYSGSGGGSAGGGGGATSQETGDSATNEETDMPLPTGSGGGSSSDPASIVSPYGSGSDFGSVGQDSFSRGGLGDTSTTSPQFQAQTLPSVGGLGSPSGTDTPSSVFGQTPAPTMATADTSQQPSMMGVLVGITAAASPMVALMGKLVQAKSLAGKA